jgi:hypothetical protein
MLPENVIPEKNVRTDSLEELRDYLVNDFRVTYATTDLGSIEINSEGTVRWNGEEMAFTQVFLESLAGFIEMPRDYAYKINFELFKQNFDRRKAECCCGVKICICRNAAINICRAAYYPARTLDILDRAQKQAVEKKLHEAVISDFGVDISWIDGRDLITPIPGDTIHTGLRISNSETGGRALKCSRYTLRLICKNGATLTDEWGAARWSYDRRVTYNANLDHFFEDIKRIEGKQAQLSDIYKKLVDEPLTDSEFVNLWRRARAVVGPQDADDILYTGPRERHKLFNQVRSRLNSLVGLPTSWNRYDTHNRITAAARRYEFLKWRRLEEIGGSLLRRASEN